jgi:hypothetical protein
MSVCYETYEFIEIGVDKTVFHPGHVDCLPEYTWSNGWQRTEIFFDGNKMVKIQNGNKQVVTVWEFSDQEMVMTVTVDHIVARKYYQRTHSSISGIFSCLERWCID